MRKFLAAALLALWTTLAHAQAPSPVPALPDTPRINTYSISATTCACSVGFALYGDGTDVDNWIQVFIGSTAFLSTDPASGWVLTSPSGSIGNIARPITDAILTFNQPQTGTVTIVGARRPRRITQFQENRGVAARDLNQAITDEIAILRERWDYGLRSIAGQPGEVLKLLPPVASRQNLILGFDSSGQPVPVNTAPGTLATNVPNTWTALQTFTGGLSVSTLAASPINGGSATNSTLVLQSTTGAGASDFIQFNTGSQVQRGKIQTDGSFIWSTGTSSINVATYDGVTNSGKTAWQITNSDNSALTATEHYSAWIGATSQGTGDGTPQATTFALGLSAIKANWQTTTVLGEFGGLNIAARCGHNNAVQSGDCSGITTNVAVSQTNNFVTQVEGVSGYFPGGSTTNSLFINAQVGSIKATGLDTGSNTGIGFFAQAQNGSVGNAFSASNLCVSPKFGTCGKWLTFLNYSYDDGTHTPYNAFQVNQSGQLTLAGFGAVNTNQKTLRVGVSVANNLEIMNAANSTVIMFLTDSGVLGIPGTVTGTPVASLCLDASNNVIKKTTTGSCI